MVGNESLRWTDGRAAHVRVNERQQCYPIVQSESGWDECKDSAHRGNDKPFRYCYIAQYSIEFIIYDLANSE